MRGLLIFLAIAAVLTVANPAFWWIIDSHVGAAPASYVEHDGIKRDAAIGPKSPWPEWVPLLPGAELVVESHFAAAPGHAEQGMGQARFAEPVEAAMAQLVERLDADGWTVGRSRFAGTEPSTPPRPLVVCTITAERTSPAVQSVTFRFQIQPAADSASVFWIMGPAPEILGARPDGC